MYWQVYSVVEGALDEEDYLFSWPDVEAWCEARIAEGKEEGYVVDVYVIEHPHSPDLPDEEEDTCAQYLASHLPFMTTEE